MKSIFHKIIKKIDFNIPCLNRTNKYHQYIIINTMEHKSTRYQHTGYQQVGEFHEVFGHPLNTEQQIQRRKPEDHVPKVSSPLKQFFKESSNEDLQFKELPSIAMSDKQKETRGGNYPIPIMDLKPPPPLHTPGWSP